MSINNEYPRPAQITGQLEVRLLGCQDLLESVTDRQLSKELIAIHNALEKTPKALKLSSISSSYRSYSLRGNEVSSNNLSFKYFL